MPRNGSKEEEEEEEAPRGHRGALQPRCACSFEIRPRRCASPDEKDSGIKEREGERLVRGRRKASRG